MLLEKNLDPSAEKHNAAVGNIAVAYLVQDETVVAICGARNEKQAVENAKAGDIILDQQERKSVELFISQYKY